MWTIKLIYIRSGLHSNRIYINHIYIEVSQGTKVVVVARRNILLFLKLANVLKFSSHMMTCNLVQIS